MSPLPDASMQVIFAANEAPIAALPGSQISAPAYMQQAQTTPNAGSAYIQKAPNDQAAAARSFWSLFASACPKEHLVTEDQVSQGRQPSFSRVVQLFSNRAADTSSAARKSSFYTPCGRRKIFPHAGRECFWPD
eukprot:6091646-Amphidinium_carterae.1